MPPKSPKSPNLGICSRILRPKQKTKPICWFLAIIVSMFYSQRSRKVMMEASKKWDRQNKVIELFRDLLYDRYLIVGSDPHKSEEHKTFNEDTFVKILQGLYDMDSRNFPYNPVYNKQGYVDSYLCKLYTLLGVDYKMFEIVHVGGRDIFYYSSLNIDAPRIAVYEDDGHAPSILMIANHPHPDYKPLENNEIKDGKVKLSSFMKEQTYNGFKYSLDSVILMNTNIQSCNHNIVGLTCKNKKYVYNGLPYMGRNFPCVLIPHNWNIQKDKDFYLSANDCELHDTPQPKPYDISYNFSKGNFTFIYVRKNASRDTSASKESDVEKYRQGREAVRLEEEIERARLLYEEKEKQQLELALMREDKLVAFMAKLKLDDSKRKRSSSNSSPKLIPKKQDRRVIPPKKATTKRGVKK